MPRACAISAPRCSRAAISRSWLRYSRDCSDVVTVLDGERADRLGAEFLFSRRGAAVLRRRHCAGAAACGQRFHVLGGDAARGRARLPPVRLRPQQARHRRVRLQAQLGLRAGAAALPLPPGARRRRSRTTIRSTRNTGCSSPPGSACRCRSPICSARRSCAGSAEAPCATCCSCRIAFPIRPTRATRSARGTSSATWRAPIACISAASSTILTTGSISPSCARTAPILPACRSIRASQRIKALLRTAPRPAAVARLFP